MILGYFTPPPDGPRGIASTLKCADPGFDLRARRAVSIKFAASGEKIHLAETACRWVSGIRRKEVVDAHRR